MEEVLLYIVQSSVILSLLYLFYFLIFRKETNYSFNRIFLVSAGLISMIIPLVKFKSAAEAAQSKFSVWLPLKTTTAPVHYSAPAFSFTEIILFVYLTVCIVLTAYFFFNLLRIYVLIRKNSGNNSGSSGIIINGKISPFSFFGYIFLPDENMTENDLNYILAHELVHIKKYHSADKLFAEILTVIQWFNPIVYLYKKELTAQHELAADSELIRQGTDIDDYVSSLFEFSVFAPGSALSNSYNSLLKRRLEMIGKISTARFPLVKSIITLLFVAVILILTGTVNGCRNDKSSENVPVKPADALGKNNAGQPYTFVEKMPEFPGGSEALLDYLSSNIHYPKIAKLAGIEGRVIITFVVSPNGEVGDVKVVKGLGAGCDEESIRVIKAMPKWQPGYQKGEPVAVKMSIPISFSLKN